MDTYAGQRLWPIIGTAAVAAVWTVSAFANYWASYQYGTPGTVEGYFLGGASVASDLLKAAAIFAAAAAFAHGRKFVGCCAVLILILCVGWSVRSAVYFASSVAQENLTARGHSSSVLEAEHDLLKLQSRRAGFVAEQTVESRKTSDVIAERKRTAEEFAALTANIREQIDSLKYKRPTPAKDPIADVMGLDEKSTLAATAIGFAVLVEVVSVFGFWVIAASRPATYPTTPLTAAAPVPQAPQYVEEELEPQPIAAPNVFPFRARPSAPAPAARPVAKDGQAQAALRRQIEEAVAIAIRDSVRPNIGKSIPVAELYTAVAQGLPDHPYDEALSERNAVAKIVTERMNALGYKKKKIRGRFAFVGCALAA